MTTSYRAPNGRCMVTGLAQGGCRGFAGRAGLSSSAVVQPCSYCEFGFCQNEALLKAAVAGGKFAERPPVVFYHGSDNDGLTCAAVVHAVSDEFMRGGRPPDIDLRPWDYHFPPPSLAADASPCLRGRVVYVLDVSFDPDTMRGLARLHEEGEISLVWVDHHDDADALAAEHGYDWVPGGRSWRDPATGRPLSAAEITAGLFLHRMPEAVTLISKYDVFHRDDDWEAKTLPFQYGLRSKLSGMSKNECVAFISRAYVQGSWKDASVEETVLAGKPVIEYISGVCQRACAVGVGFELLGQRVFAANVGWFGSLVFDSLPRGHKYDVGVTYSHSKYGWKWSAFALRPGADASAIARHMGGGGRPSAAGWQGGNPALLMGAQGDRRDALDLLADALRGLEGHDRMEFALELGPPHVDGITKGCVTTTAGEHPDELLLTKHDVVFDRPGWTVKSSVTIFYEVPVVPDRD